MDELINPHIKNLQTYVPGKPIEELERELGLKDIIKLASNENPLGPSPLAVQAIQEAVNQIHRYPDGGGYYLRRELARHLGVSAEQLILGNGSDEILALICHALLKPGEEVIYAYPSFVEYELISTAYGAKGIPVPLKDFTHDLPAMGAALTPRTKLIFIANPNNPTGTMVDMAAFDAFMQRLPPGVIVVVDEAYYEFVSGDDFPCCLDYIRRDQPLIVTRTFSKAYGLAGLRIGYAVACTRIMDYLNRVRHPFNVNTLAQVAARAALKDREHLKRSRRLVKEERDYICRCLEGMGLEYVPSVANFVLIKVGKGQEVYQRLLQQGVIVRAMGVYGLDDYIRVTVGTQPENRRFIGSLSQILKDSESSIDQER